VTMRRLVKNALLLLIFVIVAPIFLIDSAIAALTGFDDRGIIMDTAERLASKIDWWLSDPKDKLYAALTDKDRPGNC
jgi:hypothetical protein